MFYRLITENFKSFGDVVQFDMFPNPKREHLNRHVYSRSGMPDLMKMAAIYGANGAGKSNLYKAFEFLKSFFTQFGTNRAIRDWYGQNRYSLPVLVDNPPVSFLLEFEVDGVVYIIDLEIDENGVRKEELSLSGLGKSENRCLYLRRYDKIDFPSITLPVVIKKMVERQLVNFRDSSFLAINGSLRLIDRLELINPFVWFSEKLLTLSYVRNIPQLIDLFSQDKALLDFTNRLFSHVGLGLQSLDIKNKSFDEWFASLNENEKQLFMERRQMVGENISLTKMENDRPIASVTSEDGARIVRELLFRQFGKDGYVGDMDVAAQSNGTIKLLILMPAIFKFMTEETCVCIDELDNGLHPKLLKALVQYLGSSSSHGQLIFTTHEDYLLNQREVLRPDEIWIVDKKDGISRLYSINDFKLHGTISIQNGYMDDRFGGTPIIELN